MAIADFSLRGKRALVTGGSKGIGRAIATLFAEAGADVAVAARSRAELEIVEAEIGALDCRAVAVQADLSDSSDVDRLARQAVEALGGLDILVNNAGMIGSGASAFDVGRATFDQLVHLNLYAPLRLAQRCRTALGEGGGGVIINMSSIGGLKPLGGASLYWASKAALISMTRTLAIEWASHGIRCVAIAPGLVRTEMGSPHIERLERAGIQRTLLRTFSEPGDIANLALFLASPAGRSANASTYVVDDGTLAMSLT